MGSKMTAEDLEKAQASAAKEVKDGDRGDDFVPDDGGTAEGKGGTAEAGAAEGPADGGGGDAGDDAGADAGGKAAAEDPEGDDGGADDSGKNSRIQIPKHRFDSAQAARRKAEQEVARLQDELKKFADRGEGKPAADSDIPADQAALDAKQAELDDKIAQAQLDDDKEAVRKLVAESRRLEREFLRNEARTQTERASTQTLAQVKLDQTISMLEEQYEQFNPDGEKYDEELVNETLELHEALMLKGYSPSDAMLRAVGYVMNSATPEEPGKDGKGARSTKTDLRKNIDTANRNPPDTEGLGAASDKSGIKATIPDIKQMSEEDFDALPEATKKRMRGDFA